MYGYLNEIAGGQCIGKKISELHEHLSNTPTHIAAIFRGFRSIPVSNSTVLESGDEVFFISATQHVETIMSALGRTEDPYKRIIIAGGGNVGFRLASALEEDYAVKVIEINSDQSKYLAEQLNNTTVLHGDATDKELLINENIEYTDVFCALTHDDEDNIMAAMQAKRLGVRQVMALIIRTAYVDLIEGGDIDIAISPQQATIGSILTYVRRGDIVNDYSLRRGTTEAIEVIVHGDKKTSKIVGRTLSEIKLPKGDTIAAIVRGDDVLIASKDLVIEPDDHVILFLAEKVHMREVERLFQVNVGYI